MPALQHDQLLRLARPLVRAERLVGHGQMIAERHHHEQRRRTDQLDVGARLIAHEQLDRAQGHDILPGRRPHPAGFREPLPGVRRGQRRGAGRILGNHRQGRRRLAPIALQPILGAHRLDRGDHVGADQPARIAIAADQRHLRRDAFDAPIRGAEHQHMRAAVAGAPDPDAPAVGLGPRQRVADRVPVVGDLPPRVDLLARLSVTRAEVAVVEHQRSEPGRGEHFREAVEVHLLHRGEAVRHHDGRPRPPAAIGPVVPAAQHHPIFGAELDIRTHCCLPHSTISRVGRLAQSHAR